MSEKEQPQPKAEEKPQEAVKSGGKPIVLILIVLIVGLALGGGGGWFFLAKMSKSPAKAAASHQDSGDGHGDEHAEEEPEEEAEDGKKPQVAYHEMKPGFVVNLNDEDGVRYLQIELSISVLNEKLVDEIKLHEAAIRYTLMMLFSQQHYQDLLTTEGKEKLRKSALAELKKVFKEKTGKKKGIDNIYFTSFVSQ